MSKQEKKTVPSNKQSTGFLSTFDLGTIIPEKFRTPAAILGIIILLFAFYSPVMFGDKTVTGTDYLQMKSMRTYINKTHDGFSLWNPYIFGGMPAYATSTELRWFDLSAVVYSSVTKVYSAIFTDANAIYTFSFLLMAITAFMFMRSRGAGHGVSFLVAVAMMFSTGISVLYFIGHVTKLMSLALLPFILMMLLKFQKKITWFDILLTVFGMHILVLGAHVQIVFYAVLFTVIYFIFYFVYSAVKKDNFLTKQLLKSLGVMSIAAVFALLMSFDTYFQLFEYKQFSTRGTKGINELASAGKQRGGTDSYEYNTSYSFSPGEVMTFVIPSYYGFGNSTYRGPLEQYNGMKINTYFGQMPMVDTAMYMGVIIFVLGLFAFFVMWKDPFIKYCAVVLAFFLLISFGYTFPLVYDLMYYHFPAFNNFRVPSMILHVTQVFFPIIAGLGVIRIIELKKEGSLKLKNIVMYFAIAFTGLLFLSFILTSTLSTGYLGRMTASQAFQGEKNQMLQVFSEYAADMFTGDVHVALFLIALLFWSVYAFLSAKMSKTVFITAVTLLALFDLIRIDSRGASFENADEYNAPFKAVPSYVNFIKEQNDKEPFRMISFKGDQSLGSINFSFNYNVNFLLEDACGYSAAKPRGYQDLLDVVKPGNPFLWRMTGVKYVVVDKPVEIPYLNLVKNDQSNCVYRFDGALPRAYFVDSVGAKSGIELLTSMQKQEFDPKHTAYVDNIDFKVSKPSEAAYVKIAKYSDAKMELGVNATGNNFLFFSTNYVVPGWKALIDGKETKIYKTNHTFMGAIIPEGKHKVEFAYLPSSFVTGKYVSLILNILLFGGIIAAVVIKTRKKKEVPQAE
jgi:hypothetical protein